MGRRKKNEEELPNERRYANRKKQKIASLDLMKNGQIREIPTSEECLKRFPSGEDIKYNIIYADPPWKYSFSSNTAGTPYQCMSEEELSNLPVQRICDKHSVLFLWSTAPFLDAAFRLINAWGFKYKTVWKVWRKIYRNGEPRVGCGHWVRGNCEFLLVAARGSPLKLFQQHKKEKQEYVAPITVHSEKPREIRDLIQKFLKAPNKIELFAREIVPGWSAWGLEVPGCYHIDPSISKEKIQEEGEDEEDFQLQEEHEFLTIYPKDTLKIIEKFENGWWVGELNDGTMGVFPGPKDVDESKPLPFIIVRPSKE